MALRFYAAPPQI